MANGPLNGVRVVEFAGIGPAPFVAMLLSDMGAEVVRIDRPGQGPSGNDVTCRGRASLHLDLKSPDGVATGLGLLAKADVLIEGFRPGVMERLGLGPEAALAANPRLVYGRMTGWGQDGPLAQAAGHDIGYIAVAGALDGIGEYDGPPIPPLNLVGDFGGGALYLAMGISAALFERERSGKGQVIDAAIVDGTASLMANAAWLRADRMTDPRRGRGLLGGAAPFYRCYRCADDRWIAVGAIEPHFWAQLMELVEAPASLRSRQYDDANWAQSAETLAAIFRERPAADWLDLLEGTDACVSPVLDAEASADHPHMVARGSWVRPDGKLQPAPAPRFSRTPGAIQGPPPAGGQGGVEILERWGVAKP
jgi:alpha-methylacyl-CoA racemase